VIFLKETISEFLKNFKNGTKLMFKEFFNKETNKKQRANMWTFSRLIISFLIPICSLISVLTGNIGLFIASLGLTGFGGLTDFFDGRSARKHNSFSEYGKTLDQVADKIFSGMVGINLAIFNPMFLITLLGEILIMGVNAAYKIPHPELDIKSTQIGRIKQWPLFTTLALGFLSAFVPTLNTITNILIILTALFQITTAFSYIKANNINVKKLINKKNDTIIENTNNNELNNEKVKTKSIEDKSNKNISKLEQYTKLRDLLNEIINAKNDDELINENGYQKTKK